jgi:uncharacterized membrane protein required for colicin V production
MSLDQLPINFFDALVVVVLAAGIARGRKHGMSEELLSVLMWLGIVVTCAALYEPGGALIGQFTTLFGRLTCYLLAYLGSALLVVMLFVGIRRGLGGKLLGSDVFGRAEYYLGMGAGLVRFSCILLAALALLNARYFSPTEVRAMQKYDEEWYGNDYFPGLHALQATVFDKSLSGRWIKDSLGFLLIKPTEPEDKQLHQKEFVVP